MTKEEIGMQADVWLECNGKQAREVQHEFYPVGFVAMLLEHFEEAEKCRPHYGTCKHCGAPTIDEKWVVTI